MISRAAIYGCLALLFTAIRLVPELSAQDIIQEVTAPSSPILHQAPQPSQIPAPGKLLTLNMLLKDQRDLDLRAEILVTRDGKLMALPYSRSYLNEQDYATYEFNIYAPLAEASYIFVIYPRESEPSTSRRYVIRRTCLPKVDLTQLTPPLPDSQKGELDRMRELLEQAKGLETDLQNYETALQLIKEIKVGVTQ